MDTNETEAAVVAQAGQKAIEAQFEDDRNTNRMIELWKKTGETRKMED